MKYKTLLFLALSISMIPETLRSEDADKWKFDVSIYGLAAGMSGDAAVKGVPADVDVGFDQIWDNLKFGAMGTMRVSYDRWSLSADVIYMDLEGSKGAVTAGLSQWMVQPALEYTICQYFGVYAGARYNNIDMKLSGPFAINPSGTEDWWDPIIGARASMPMGKKFSAGFNGDIGGFGVGSDLTWQAFPYVSWQFAKSASLQLGYRLLYSDYESGSGLSRFQYDILTHGPQLGVAFHF